ncbi:HGxxPAAW family protein [Streptomyces ochraceiscleroticus]|uniref:HGxxPAAW family protein n=1 Tax=Streptomyces ochraceiscleroticus TaxID=47761 RepID=A0ABW1MGJ1_9ACTN|nr:HGxxPAAW family protein [Streptomyces ochraceiscleroticus]
MSSNGHGHGHTPAAWTGVIISFIGFCVAGVFTVLANVPGFWAGIVLIFAGAVVGGLMRLAGMGSEPKRAKGSPQPQES